jgi:Flp pilus assembly protein TadG
VRRFGRRARVRGRRAERGASTIEFVLVFPFVLIIIFLVAEMSSALRTWLVLENASREGARFAAVRNSASATINRTVAMSAGILNGCGGCVTVTNAWCGGSGAGCGRAGDDVTVAVNYTYTFKTPLARFISYVSGGTIPNTMRMQATTHMRLE